MTGRLIVLAVGVVLLTTACKRRDDRAAPLPDAAVAPRPRPAQVAHLTLKVLGMT